MIVCERRVLVAVVVTTMTVTSGHYLAQQWDFLDSFADLYFCLLIRLGAVSGKSPGGRLYKYLACS